MCMTSYFHVISGSGHGVGPESACNRNFGPSHDQCPKKDGGVDENLVRASALKSENPLFTVIIHPSYVNGKDRAVSFQLNVLLGFLNA